jgi:hypothetical protein
VRAHLRKVATSDSPQGGRCGPGRPEGRRHGNSHRGRIGRFGVIAVAVVVAALAGGAAPHPARAVGPLTAAAVSASPNPVNSGQYLTLSWTATGFPNLAVVVCSDNQGWVVNGPYSGSVQKVAGYDFNSSFTWTVTCTDGDFYGTGSVSVTYVDEIDSGGDPAQDGSDPVGSSRCQGNQYSRTWKLHRGSLTHYQDTFLHMIWCGYPGGAITYWHGWVTTGTLACSAHDSYVERVSGGVGYGSVTVEGGSYFDCPSGIPWLTWHRHRWMQIQYYGDGGNFARHWG